MNSFSRRKFLKKSAISALGFAILPSCSHGAKGSPNGRLRVAIVGAGGRGEVSVESFGNISLGDIDNSGKLGGSLPTPKGMKIPPCEIVALCDVDWNWASKAYNAFPNTPKYSDYRKMFDEMSDKIDAVAVCVPDHMHYPIAARAILENKHVFCEKPLARTVWEIRKLTRLAKERKIVAQMGNQGATSSAWRILREWYDAGILGKVVRAYGMTPCPIWPQGNLNPPKGEAVPKSLDYNLWLGVAPYMPYSKSVLPFNWRGLRNYGAGPISDMGSHILQPLFNAFDLPLPSKILADSNASTLNDYTWADKNKIFFETDSQFGKDGKIKIEWYDGGNMPEKIRGVNMEEFTIRNEFFPDKRPRNIMIIEGEKNTAVFSNADQTLMVYPRKAMADLKRNGKLPKPSIARSAYPLNPQLEFAAACLWGSAVSSPFEKASIIAETCVLGSISTIVSGTELSYDAENMKFRGNRESDKYLSSLYEYRKEFLPS